MSGAPLPEDKAEAQRRFEAALIPEFNEKEKKYEYNELNTILGNSDMKSLIDINANISSGKKYQCPPIVLAARQSDRQLLEILIAAGANVNATDSLGNTALHYTANKLKKKSTKTLLDKGADPTIKNSKNETALDELAKAKSTVKETDYNHHYSIRLDYVETNKKIEKGVVREYRELKPIKRKDIDLLINLADAVDSGKTRVELKDFRLGNQKLIAKPIIRDLLARDKIQREADVPDMLERYVEAARNNGFYIENGEQKNINLRKEYLDELKAAVKECRPSQNVNDFIASHKDFITGVLAVNYPELRRQEAFKALLSDCRNSYIESRPATKLRQASQDALKITDISGQLNDRARELHAEAIDNIESKDTENIVKFFEAHPGLLNFKLISGSGMQNVSMLMEITDTFKDESAKPLISRLASIGADVNAKIGREPNAISVIDYAIKKENIPVIEALLEEGAIVNPERKVLGEKSLSDLAKEHPQLGMIMDYMEPIGDAGNFRFKQEHLVELLSRRVEIGVMPEAERGSSSPSSESVTSVADSVTPEKDDILGRLFSEAADQARIDYKGALSQTTFVKPNPEAGVEGSRLSELLENLQTFRGDAAARAGATKKEKTSMVSQEPAELATSIPTTSHERTPDYEERKAGVRDDEKGPARKLPVKTVQVVAKEVADRMRSGFGEAASAGTAAVPTQGAAKSQSTGVGRV